MGEKQNNPLGTEAIGSLLARFAVPSIIAMLVSSLYNIVDQFFIGRSVGMLGNAATNVAFPLSITCTALALLCGIGGAANFNLSMGRNEKEKAVKFAGGAIGMMLTLGILLCILVRIFLEPMMRAFGATDQILDYALTYTGITSLGFPFLIVTTGGSNLIRADGSPKFSMICTLTGAIINTILDPLFIFVLDMGMAGAAWVTIIGQIVSGIMVLIYFSRFKTVHIPLKTLIPSKSAWIPVISLGVAPFCNQLAMMIVQIVMNNTLTHYGGQSSYGSDIPLACAGIISKVGMIFFAIVIGISQGIQPIISYNYGAGNYERVKQTYKKAVTAALGISMVAFLLFQLAPRQIIGIFGSGSEEYFLFAEKFFRIYMFFTFINGIQPITANTFTSIGKAGKGVFLSLTRQIIFIAATLLIVLFGSIPAMRPVFNGAALDMPSIIEILMLCAAAIILIISRTDGIKATQGSVFPAGMQAVIAIFGIAWMGDTFINGNITELTGSIEGIVRQMPWLFGLALFVMSILLYSQAATVRAIVPLGIALGISPMMLIALFPAVNGYFFIPNYPTVVAAINFDRTGTTGIGKWILNHSFMMPGMVATLVSIVVGLLLIQVF